MASARPHRVAFEPGHHAYKVVRHWPIFVGRCPDNFVGAQIWQFATTMWRAVIVLCLQYFIFLCILCARLHLIVICMLTYMALCMTIYRYAPTSMRTFIHNLTELKFAGTEKKWPNLRGRAVEVRALTQPICNLWAAKTNYSDKTTFWSKCCWKDHANMIKWSLIIPTFRGLTIRRPDIYIYIRFFFSDTQHSFILFCLYARVYARLDNLRSLGGFSRWLQSSLLSTKRRKLHGVYLEIIFASPRNSMICSTWHSELTK